MKISLPQNRVVLCILFLLSTFMLGRVAEAGDSFTGYILIDWYEVSPDRVSSCSVLQKDWWGDFKDQDALASNFVAASLKANFGARRITRRDERYILRFRDSELQYLSSSARYEVVHAAARKAKEKGLLVCPVAVLMREVGHIVHDGKRFYEAHIPINLKRLRGSHRSADGFETSISFGKLTIRRLEACCSPTGQCSIVPGEQGCRKGDRAVKGESTQGRIVDTTYSCERCEPTNPKEVIQPICCSKDSNGCGNLSVEECRGIDGKSLLLRVPCSEAADVCKGLEVGACCSGKHCQITEQRKCSVGSFIKNVTSCESENPCMPPQGCCCDLTGSKSDGPQHACDGLYYPGSCPDSCPSVGACCIEQECSMTDASFAEEVSCRKFVEGTMCSRDLCSLSCQDLQKWWSFSDGTVLVLDERGRAQILHDAFGDATAAWHCDDRTGKAVVTISGDFPEDIELIRLDDQSLCKGYECASLWKSAEQHSPQIEGGELPENCVSFPEIASEIPSNKYRLCDSKPQTVYSGCSTTLCLTESQLQLALESKPGFTSQVVKNTCRDRCEEGFSRFVATDKTTICGRCPEDTRFNRSKKCCQ